MLLHEAVKHARKELGLSQDKLSELAGIQRRQLATLEAGGNVTLATLRKILGQLPNLETFSIDTVTATVARDVPPTEVAQSVQQALRIMSTAMRSLLDTLGKGQPPDPHVHQQIAQMTQILGQAQGYSPEDIERRKQARRLVAPPMNEEELKEFFTTVQDMSDEGVRVLKGYVEGEEEEPAEGQQ